MKREELFAWIAECFRDIASEEEAREAMWAVFECGLGVQAAKDAAIIARLEKRLEIDPRHPYDGIAARNVTIRELERDLYAAINCAHEIDSESVVLFRDPSKDGNALHQLSVRLDAAAQPVVLSDAFIRERWSSILGYSMTGPELATFRTILAAKEQA